MVFYLLMSAKICNFAVIKLAAFALTFRARFRHSSQTVQLHFLPEVRAFSRCYSRRCERFPGSALWISKALQFVALSNNKYYLNAD